MTDDSKIDDVVQIVKDIGGLHATGSTVPYLSLFARTRNFVKKYLDEELYVKRNLGKINKAGLQRQTNARSYRLNNL